MSFQTLSSDWLLWEAWQRQGLTQVFRSRSDDGRGAGTCLSQRQSVGKHPTSRDGRDFGRQVGVEGFCREIKSDGCRGARLGKVGEFTRSIALFPVSLLVCLFVCLSPYFLKAVKKNRSGLGGRPTRFHKDRGHRRVAQRSEEKPERGRPAMQVLKLSTPEIIRV